MRTLILGLLAVGAVLAAVLLRPPPPRTGLEAVSGARLVRASPRAITRLGLALDGRQITAVRVAGGWTSGSEPAAPPLAEALDELSKALASVRAVDQFRSSPQHAFGLDPPRGTIVVSTARRETHLDLGALNASATTLYVRRRGDPRIFQVGTYLLSQVGRVLDRLGTGAARPDAAPVTAPR
jgi:Domain of unknown function (DUF4340)